MVHNARRVTQAELNHRELERYVQRVADRWPIQRALLGGARVADLRGAGPQRERGPEFVVVLVSEFFDGVTADEVAAAAKSVDPETVAVACVGPHDADEF